MVNCFIVSFTAENWMNYCFWVSSVATNLRLSFLYSVCVCVWGGIPVHIPVTLEDRELCQVSFLWFLLLLYFWATLFHWTWSSLTIVRSLAIAIIVDLICLFLILPSSAGCTDTFSYVYAKPVLCAYTLSVELIQPLLFLLTVSCDNHLAPKHRQSNKKLQHQAVEYQFLSQL